MLRPYFQTILILSFIGLMVAGIFVIACCNYSVNKQMLQLQQDRLENEVAYTEWLMKSDGELLLTE